MRKFLLPLLLCSQMAAAQSLQNEADKGPKNEVKKMTTRDAKRICKSEGKAGPDLIKCMKEKKDEK